MHLRKFKDLVHSNRRYSAARGSAGMGEDNILDEQHFRLGLWVLIVGTTGAKSQCYPFQVFLL